MTTLRIETPEWALPLLEPARYKAAFGGRGCVHPDTLIDTPDGKVKIKDFSGGPVYSWDAGKVVIAQATPAFPCTKENLFEVVLCDGSSIIVTDEHKFLTPIGWRMLSELCPGDGVLSPPQQFGACPHRTNQGISLLELQKDGLHLTQKPEDYLGDCSECCRRCDLQPQRAKDTDQLFFRPPNDAAPHNSHALCHADGPGIVDKCIPSSSFAHVSNHGAPQVLGPLCCAGSENCSGEKSFESFSGLCQDARQFLCCKGQTQPYHALATQSQDSGIALRLAKSFQNILRRLRHGVCGKLFADQSRSFLDENGDFHYKRIRLIRLHSRQIYWDLHVFKTNNYLAQGFVNHNSGKSHCFAEMMIEAHIMEPTSRSVCVREVQRSLAQSVKRLLELKIQALNAGAYFEVQEAVIKSKRGDGLIIFQGMQNHTADSIKSLEGYDRAWVEEAQSLSQRSLDMLRPTIRKPGSELWFTWNPQQLTDPVDNLFRGSNPPADARIVEVNFDLNPWFPDVLRAEMEYDKRRDPDKYAHVWRGAYIEHSEARVFKNWRVEEFEAPRDAVHRLGADWGFANDPTVLVRCHVIGRTLYIDFEAYMVGCEITSTPDLFMSVPDSERWPMVADSSRPETISHMRRNGFPKIMPAVKGKDSVFEGIEWLRSHDIVVHPRCTHTIDELTHYSYRTDEATGKVLPLLQDANNHVIDALRYACEGMRRAAAVSTRANVTPLPTAWKWN